LIIQTNTKGMNSILYKSGSALLILGISLVLITACKKQKDYELGPKPKAGITITTVTGKVNTYLLTSTSTGSFSYRWDKGDGGGVKEGPATDTAYYAEKGNYTVKLLVLGQGGYDTVSTVINVAADDPNGCFGAKSLLTNCSSKTWIPMPDWGALWVGPNDGGGAWWQSGPGDVGPRSCYFNDEYTFKKDGSFIYDDKGDTRVDDEGGQPWPNDIGLPIGCTSNTNIPAKYKAWLGGSFTFRIVGANKLQVVGSGAHMGLYKVGEYGTTATPDPVVTYDILELTATKLTIKKQYDWGQWRFSFIAK
jgi:PKD repeat protein